MSKDDGGPAFPFGTMTVNGDYGMSLRDYFAAAAVNGMCANNALTGIAAGSAKERVEAAYFLADAMLAERAKK